MSWTTPFVLGMSELASFFWAAFFFIERVLKSQCSSLICFVSRVYYGKFGWVMSLWHAADLRSCSRYGYRVFGCPCTAMDFQITPLWEVSHDTVQHRNTVARTSRRAAIWPYGARYFALPSHDSDSGWVFTFLLLLPVNFKYPLFAAVIFMATAYYGHVHCPNTAHHGKKTAYRPRSWSRFRYESNDHWTWQSVVHGDYLLTNGSFGWMPHAARSI